MAMFEPENAGDPDGTLDALEAQLGDGWVVAILKADAESCQGGRPDELEHGSATTSGGFESRPTVLESIPKTNTVKLIPNTPYLN